MNNHRKEELPPDLNSESSVDHYVTTVNEQTSNGSDGDGSVKVRMRKKSKRRKKRNNLASEENGLFISDDNTLFRSSGSDVDPQKIPRRSSSLCESDLRNNSGFLQFRSTVAEQKTNDCRDTPYRKQESLVRRRSRKRSSIKNSRRRGMLLDHATLGPSGFSLDIVETNTSAERKPSAKNMKQWQSADSADSLSSKQMNRQDALATLNAFMVDVENATSNAKKLEGERKKDSTSPRSRLLNGNSEEANFSSLNLPPSPATKPTSPSPSLFAQQKSLSVDQQSGISGSVFASDHDDESTNQHRALGKTLSEEIRSGGERVVENPRKRVLTRQQFVRTPSDLNDRRGFSQSSLKKEQQELSNYGLEHLNQVAKLFEQIGELRKQKQALLKHVSELEAEVIRLRSEKDSVLDTSHNDAQVPVLQSKRHHAVDRFKDALSRTSRKLSSEKVEPNKISHPMMIGSPPDSSEKFSFIPNFSNSSHNRSPLSKISDNQIKKPLYSRDDLDLSSKAKFKFWKAPSRGSEQQTAKDLVSSIKAEHSQGNAVHLKSASVTLDRLLNNVNDEFGQKLVEWETVSRSRAASRASDSAAETRSPTNRPRSSTAISPLSDENVVNARLKFLRSSNEKIFGRRASYHKEKEASLGQKISDSGRSKSYDRVSKAVTLELLEAPHPRTMSASADFHRSSRPPHSGSLGNFSKLPRKFNAPPTSAEWKELQEAFPTKPPPASNSSLRPGHFRRKKNPEKRSTWTHSKFEGNFYLPNSADFTHRSNLEIAGSMGDQVSLRLDQKDIEAVGTPVSANQVSRLTPKTAIVREKLTSVDKVNHSSKAKGRAARFSRRSHRVEILRLSSCEVLASSPTMQPLIEEPSSGQMSRSLPDLPRNSDANESSDGSRRYTVTVIDLKPSGKKKLEATQSAPSNLEKLKDVGDMAKLPVVRSISDRPSDKSTPRVDTLRRKKWMTSNLLNSRRKDATITSAAEGRHPQIRSERKPELPPVVQKPKTKSGKRLPRLSKLSPKTRSNSVRTNATAAGGSPTSKPSKKKQSRFFSFRAESPFKSPKKIARKLSDQNENSSPIPEDNGAIQIIAFDESDDATLDDGNESKTTLKRKPSKKIVEISERLTDDSSASSRGLTNPAPISKGIVNRLSKRFVRPDKEKDGKKSIPSGSYVKNTNFLTAKNRFEKRALSDSKTSTLPRPTSRSIPKPSTPPVTRRSRR